VKGSKSLPWIAGTAFLAILILAFAWFVVVTPARDSAATDRAAASQQESQNDLLAIQNAKLASEFAKLDDYKAELAQAQRQIPASIDQPTFSRELDDLATQSGVWISNIAFSSSLNVAESAPKPKTTKSATTDDETSTDGSSSTPEASPAQADSTPSSKIPASMFAVPVSVTIIGSPKDTQTFLERFQGGDGRLVLVTDLAVDRQDETPSSNGSPAIKDGDFQTTVTGLTYILHTTSGSTSKDAG